MQVDQNSGLNLQISQLVVKFGNIENFKEIMENNGYIMIKSDFITWYYVAQIMSGIKKLLKASELRNYVTPPRYFKKI